MMYYSIRPIRDKKLVDLGQGQGHANQGQMFKNHYKINLSFLPNILFSSNMPRCALF